MKNHPFLVIFVSIAMIVGGFMILPTTGFIDNRTEAEKTEHRKLAMEQMMKRFPVSKREGYTMKDAIVHKNRIVVKDLAYASEKPLLRLTVKKIELPVRPIGAGNNREETRFRDVIVKAEDLPPLAGFYLKQLGFDKLVLQAHTRHTYQPDKKTYLAWSRYELKDGAVVEAEITLGGVTPEFARGVYSDLNMTMKHLSLVRLKFTIRNKGILKKILRMVPGGNEQFLLTALDREAAKARTDNRRKTVRAMKEFIIRKGSITVDIHPEKPVILKTVGSVREGFYDDRFPLDIHVH